MGFLLPLLPGCRREAEHVLLRRDLTAARAAAAQGDAARANELLAEWMTRLPEDAEVLAALAYAQQRAGQPAKAAEIYTRAATLPEPNRPRAEDPRQLHAFAAQAWRQAGDPGRARRSLLDQLQAFPQDAAAWRLLSGVEESLGNLRAAAAAAEGWFGATGLPAAAVLRGALGLRQGEKDAVETWIAIAEETVKGPVAAAVLDQAEAELAAGRNAIALSLVRAVAQTDPVDPNIRTRLRQIEGTLADAPPP